MRTDSLEIVVRDYDPKTDNGYIYSTWTKYAWYSPRDPILLTKSKFFAYKIKEIDGVLASRSVHIACLKSDPFIIMGYIVFNKNGTYPKVEWICVKKDFHNQGIDKLLIQSMSKEIDDRIGPEQ